MKKRFRSEKLHFLPLPWFLIKTYDLFISTIMYSGDSKPEDRLKTIHRN